MKHLVLTFMATIIMVSATAQKITNGIALYEQKINVHKNLSEEQQSLKHLIPEFMTNNIELHFNNGIARTKEGEKDKSGSVQISSSVQDMLINYKTGITKSYTTLGDEKFYTEDKLAEGVIKLIDKTKKIGQYTCKGAIIDSDKGDKMTIWYCKDLPKNLSPLGLLDVDGMVMQIDGESISYTFKGIKKGKADLSLLKEPKGYRKVTSEQLADLSEEYYEEMMPN
jgi:GLPGLI family protein